MQGREVQKMVFYVQYSAYAEKTMITPASFVCRINADVIIVTILFPLYIISYTY